MWRLLFAVVFLGALGQTSVTARVEWDLHESHVGVSVWEVEADGVVKSCIGVEVLSDRRRCSVTLERQYYSSVKLRGVASDGSGGVATGYWSEPIAVDLRQSGAPGSFTLQFHFEQQQATGMKKRYWLAGNVTPASSTYYLPLLQDGVSWRTTLTTAAGTIITRACTVRKLYARLDTALSAGQTATYTVVIGKASVDTVTSLEVALSGAGAQEGSDLADEVSLSPGDWVRVRRVTSGSPTFVHDWLQLEVEETDGFLLGGTSNSNIGTTTSYPMFMGQQTTTGEATSRQRMPIAGTITGGRFGCFTNIPAGATRVQTLLKNGVAQDGTSGTPDTRITLSEGQSEGSADFTLSFSPGDTIGVRWTATGTPTSERLAWGLAITPSVAGESGWWGGSPGSIAAPWFTDLTGKTLHIPDSTEDQFHRMFTVEDTFEAAYLAIHGSAVGTGNGYTYTIRKNQTDTVYTATLENATTDAVINEQVTWAVGDLFSTSLVVSSGTPANRTMGLSLKVVEISSGQVARPTSDVARGGWEAVY